MEVAVEAHVVLEEEEVGAGPREPVAQEPEVPPLRRADRIAGLRRRAVNLRHARPVREREVRQRLRQNTLAPGAGEEIRSTSASPPRSMSTPSRPAQVRRWAVRRMGAG